MPRPKTNLEHLKRPNPITDLESYEAKLIRHVSRQDFAEAWYGVTLADHDTGSLTELIMAKDGVTFAQAVKKLEAWIVLRAWFDSPPGAPLPRIADLLREDA